MQVEVKLAGLEYYDLEDLREENYEWDLSLHELREDYYDGDKIFRYQYPATPVEVALEENEHDPEALAVYLCGKKIGYVAKSQKKTVFDLHHQDVGVYVDIDGGPVKILYEDDDEKLQVERDDYPLRGKLVFVEKKHTDETAPAPEPEKKKKISPQVWLILGFIIILGYLAISFFYPIPGVVGIVFGLAVLSRGVKERKEQRNDERRKR